MVYTQNEQKQKYISFDLGFKKVLSVDHLPCKNDSHFVSLHKDNHELWLLNGRICNTYKMLFDQEMYVLQQCLCRCPDDSTHYVVEPVLRQMMDNIRWLLFAHTGSYPQMKASNAHYGTVKQVFHSRHEHNNIQLKKLRSAITKLLKNDEGDDCSDDDEENETNIWQVPVLKKEKKVS